MADLHTERRTRMYQTRSVHDPVISDLKTQIYNNDNNRSELLHRGRVAGQTTPAVQFIRACPNNDCRGFLSTRYKCGVCGIKTCSHCLEIKKENHKCNEDDLKSAEVIRRDTKPCPSCGTCISKIEGCFAKGTEIPLLNDNIKVVEDIIVGDELIGDDKTKRTVTRTFTGFSNMFLITQEKGKSYTVNGLHQLVLKNRHTNKIEEMYAEDFANDIYWNKYNGIVPREGSNKITSILLGPDMYYGFELDGNRRFLLDDGTVCKNCNQMWCTVCNKGFDWRTRKIISNERIHNPHYFQWLNQNREGNTDNNWQMGGGCEGLPAVSQLMSVLRDDPFRNDYIHLYRNLLHLQDVVILRYQVSQEDIFTRNFNLRIRYIKSEINKETWKKKLQQNEKSTLKKNEIYMALDMLCNTGTDIFRQIVRNTDPFNLVTILAQFKTLKTYYNAQVKGISSQYGCVVPLITDVWACVP